MTLVNGHFTETTADDTDIEQTLSLRMVPITAIVRFLPFGRADVVPALRRRGRRGDSVPLQRSRRVRRHHGRQIFPARYIETGTGVGPVLVCGMRIPIKGDIYALTTE